MWWHRLIGWDGVVPGLVALVPFATRLWFPANSITVLAVVVLVPMGAALVRADVGYREFRSMGLLRPPAWRQLLLALAISLLLLCEIVAGLIPLMGDAPFIAWLIPLSIYICYFVCVVAAFTTVSSSRDSDAPVASAKIDHSIAARY